MSHGNFFKDYPLQDVAHKTLRLAVDKPVVTLDRHAAVTTIIAATLAIFAVMTPLVDVCNSHDHQ